MKNGGVNSGFMIAQVTAAALASENKALAHPHSVDSLPTSANPGRSCVYGAGGGPQVVGDGGEYARRDCRGVAGGVSGD